MTYISKVTKIMIFLYKNPRRNLMMNFALRSIRGGMGRRKKPSDDRMGRIPEPRVIGRAISSRPVHLAHTQRHHSCAGFLTPGVTADQPRARWQAQARAGVREGG